ncbi:alpha/beta hydrolase [Microbulbifer sp. VAAC004]|jgi:pimeloyl-ACP methyl ester carboxylesterase|uniref:alpha/beta hydrolase n=1 Tax=unclassified Microbulbifer TaxID=2619833 RepID=UPI004039AFA3
MPIKMKSIKLFLTISICLLASSCAVNIRDYIASSKSFPYDHIVSNEQIKSWGFHKNNYCDKLRNLCISYFSADPLEKGKIKYSIETDSGDQTSQVNLSINKEALNKHYSGTIILLHGFRISKEFMLHSALYFRLLGFQVVIPDLLGHGESEGRKEYGVGDSEVINRLIDELIHKDLIESKNIYLLGNSMGSLTAARITQSRQDISGLILQAPMLEFDQAVYNYAQENFPLLSRAFSEKEIKIGASMALEEANISLLETQIEPLLTNTPVPVLLFASNTDPISPYDHFQNLHQDHIKIVLLKDRNHPSMAVIGEIEHSALQDWLPKASNITIQYH